MPKHLKIFAFTDGGCRGNPGNGAIAILLLDKEKNKLTVHSECIGQTTNNRAEYLALIKALELSTAHCRDEICCYSDSELVVRQASGKYAIKKKELLELFYILKDREKAFKKVTYNHVPRENKYIQIVDKILNRTMDTEDLSINEDF